MMSNIKPHHRHVVSFNTGFGRQLEGQLNADEQEWCQVPIASSTSSLMTKISQK
jgi:hypothetical protein